MIAPGPTLTTARLILRPTAREDFDGWAELMADEENSGFIGGPQERPAAWRGMMSMAGAWALEGYAMFSVLDKETGEWLGRIGPWVPEGWPGTEVGWALLKKAWGKGYAVEAAEATIDWTQPAVTIERRIRAFDPFPGASTALGAPCGVAPPCAQQCAASSRLAWHTDHSTGRRIQLRFLG